MEGLSAEQQAALVQQMQVGLHLTSAMLMLPIAAID
jgi:hypothetical protein